jgi:hypothetical protein
MTPIGCYNGHLNHNIENAEKMRTLIAAAKYVPAHRQHLVKEAMELFNQELEDQVIQAAERLQKMRELSASAKLKAESPELAHTDS